MVINTGLNEARRRNFAQVNRCAINADSAGLYQLIVAV
jgi:hypothetical protein